MRFDFCITGTVGKDHWYSNDHIMLKGTTSQKPNKTSVKMDKVFKEATSELTLAKRFKREYLGPQGLGMWVRVESSTGTIIAEKYFKMLQKDWTLFIGGIMGRAVNKERHVVAKKRNKVVAIVASMSR